MMLQFLIQYILLLFGLSSIQGVHSIVVHGFSCDFDGGDMCGMTQSLVDESDWIISGGQTTTPGTGPEDDVSLGGKYIYFDAKSVTNGDSAIIVTPELVPSVTNCSSVEFWYHSYGRDLGMLLVRSNVNGINTGLWITTNKSYNEWQNVTIEFLTANNFTVEFLANAVVGDRGDYAVDEIKITSCSNDVTNGPRIFGSQKEDSFLSGMSTMSQPTGSIQSPNWPNLYPDNSQYVWILEVSASQRLHITVHDLQLEGDDYLQIKTDAQPGGSEYNVSSHPFYAYSVGNWSRIEFYSDVSGRDKGFNITWAAFEKGPVIENVTGLSGVLESPFYPSHYPTNYQHTWNIAVDSGYFINIKGSAVDLGSSDYVTVDNIENGTVTRLGFMNVGNSYLTTGNTAQVFFYSSATSVSSGFHVEWRAIALNGTTDILHSTESNLTYPGYPALYPLAYMYKWYITVAPDDVITLRINAHNLPYPSDYLKIFSVNSTKHRLREIETLSQSFKSFLSDSNMVEVFFFSDLSESYPGGFFIQWSQIHLSSNTTSNGVTSGAIQPTTSPYPTSLMYRWYILAPNDTVISWMVNYTHLEICCDSLQIWSIDNDMVRTGNQFSSSGFTFSETKGNSPTSMMEVYFYSDPAITYINGFLLSWIVIDTPTVEVVSGNVSGIITSPNYPSSYPETFQKRWIITVDEGLVISLKVFHGVLDTGDYIEIFNMVNNTRTDSIVKFSSCCATNTQYIYRTTSGNQAEIYMYSDISSTATGFALGWSQTSLSPQNFTLNDTKGVVTSPDFPGEYPHATRVHWYLIGPVNARISFRVNESNLESCCDGLEVYEIDPDDRTRTKTLYQSAGNIKVNSDGRAVEFYFFSDSAISFERGFVLTYTFIDLVTNNVNETTAIIQAPNFPEPYPASVQYTWLITIPVGEQLNIKVTESALDTWSDYLEIYELVNGTRVNQLLSYSGTYTSNRFLVASSTQIEVYFFSDIDTTYSRGFYVGFFSTVVNYTTFINDETRGDVKSPNYPMLYPEAYTSTWTIEVNSSDSFIGFIVNEVHLEETYDILKITGGDLGLEMLEYTGLKSSTPSKNKISGHKMEIYFYSDAAITFEEGFWISWQEMPLTIANVTSTQFGMLRSPNYPGLYPTAQQYKWFITVSAGSQVYVKVTEVNTDTCCDFLQIFDIINKTRTAHNSPPMSYVSTNQFYTSLTNQIEVYFISDMADQSTRGFSLGWHSTNLDHTNETFSSSSGIISSPNYPGDYTDSVKRSWFIDVTSDSLIGVKLNAYTLEDCCDVAEVYHIVSGSRQTSYGLASIFASSAQKFVSAGPALEIYFYADPALLATGFELEWAEIALTKVVVSSSQSGIIQSANYPGNYPESQHYKWYITVSQGSQVYVKVANIDLESCCDYIQIFNTLNYTRPSGAQISNKMSGVSSNQLYTSTTNQIEVYFLSDISVTETGFLIGWHSSDLYHFTTNVTGLSGTVNSPNYPANYDNSYKHSWFINRPSGYTINVKIVNCHLEDGYDFIQIYSYNGNQKSLTYHPSFLSGSISGEQTDGISLWFDHDDQVEIYFYADPVIAARGFEIKWVLVEMKASIPVSSATLGSIQSPAYGLNDYPTGYRQTWTVTASSNVAADFEVLLKIEEFAVESCCDSVELIEYKGGVILQNISLSKETSVFGTNPSVQYFTLEGPTFSVSMKSDATNTNRGFSIAWMTVPLVRNNETVVINETVQQGVITSPGNPSYPMGYQHSWFFDTTTVNGSFNVKLAMLSFEMESCCDYMEVFDLDQEGQRLVSLGRYSGRMGMTFIENSTSSYMEVYFYSDPSIASRGFTLFWAIQSTIPTTQTTFFDTQGNSPAAIAACVILLCGVAGFIALLCYCKRNEDVNNQGDDKPTPNSEDVVLEDVETASHVTMYEEVIEHKDGVEMGQEVGNSETSLNNHPDGGEAENNEDSDGKHTGDDDIQRDKRILMAMYGKATPSTSLYQPPGTAIKTPTGEQTTRRKSFTSVTPALSVNDITPMDESNIRDIIYDNTSDNESPLPIATSSGVGLTVIPQNTRPFSENKTKSRSNSALTVGQVAKSIAGDSSFSEPVFNVPSPVPSIHPTTMALPTYDMPRDHELATPAAPPIDIIYETTSEHEDEPFTLYAPTGDDNGGGSWLN